MSDQPKENIAATIQLKGIELLKGILDLPVTPNFSVSNFNFEINLENKIDAENQLIFVLVNINIKGDDVSNNLGSLSVSCIFEMLNFTDVVKVNEGGQFEIPTQINEILNSISISTARGVMFSTFKGTFLHNAVLPIIDPRQLKPQA